MGDIDAVVKEYLKNAEVVVDIGNFKLYEGEQRIRPERLREMDTAVLTVPYGTDQAALPVQKFRDRLVAVIDEGVLQIVHLVLGNEVEAETKYAEPAKLLYYDAAEYADQVTRAGASRKRERKENQKTQETKKLTETILSQLGGEAAAAAEDSAPFLSAKNPADGGERPTSGEFLGNFYKTDRLVPTITIVLHLSPDYWDGPRRLHEMFGDVDDAILRHIPDYHINLISPAELTEEELNLFRTDLREVLLYIKYSRDKEKLRQLTEDTCFRNISRAALDVINKVTNSNIPYRINQKGECEMCSGLKGMLEDERAAGRAEERAAGDARVQDTIVTSIKNVMESFGVSGEQAMQALKLPEIDFPKYSALL